MVGLAMRVLCPLWATLSFIATVEGTEWHLGEARLRGSEVPVPALPLSRVICPL